MPRVQFEWKINLTTLLAVVSAIVTSVLAYSDLKSDVRDTKTRAEAKYAEYDDKWRAQKLVDDEQNARIVRVFNQLSDLIREVKQDLRSDIRDLRGDLVKATPREVRVEPRESSREIEAQRRAMRAQ